MSRIDEFARKCMVFSRMFSRSWGSPEVLKKLKHYHNKYTYQGAVMELIDRDMPKMFIEKDEISNGIRMQKGWFVSPLNNLALFKNGDNVAKAHWCGYFPASDRQHNGLVVHLAPNGDSTYWLRHRSIVEPLLRRGISSIMLQTPFFGDRKLNEQGWWPLAGALDNVSDLYLLGGSMIAECCFLLRWARENGHFSLGLSGISLGGFIASLAATNIRDEPISLTPMLSWTSAAPAFTQGVLSKSVNWKILEKELNESKELKKVLKECWWWDMLDDETHPAYKLLKDYPNSRARRLMWILMEDFTNLSNFPVPLDPSRVHFVVSEIDAYIPRSELIPDVEQLWPGASVTYLPDEGHLGSYFWYQSQFREKILKGLGCPPLVEPPVSVNAIQGWKKTATTITLPATMTGSVSSSVMKIATTVTAPIGRAANQMGVFYQMARNTRVSTQSERTIQK